MPIAIYSTICTPIGLVNVARYLSVSIVLNNNNIFNL